MTFYNNDDDDDFIKYSSLFVDLLYGYKTNILLPLSVEVSKLSIIIQINAGSLKRTTFG